MTKIDLLIKICAQTLAALEEFKAANPCTCEEPEDPEEPTDPEDPEEPEEPTDPEEPEEPTDPEEPEEPEEPEPPTAVSIMGTNIHALVDWSPEYAFLDIFKQARPWVSGTSGGAWEDGRPVAVDANGWPTSLATNQVLHTFVYWSNIKPSFKSGNYVLTYEGDGSLSLYHHDGIVSQAPGRIVVKLNANANGLAMDLTRTNPSNPLRNIKILPEESQTSTELFNPAFVESLRGYGFIRFMDWGKTNDSAQFTWEDRPKPTNAFYTTEKGAPIEVMVQLANTLNVDAWFCMGHRQSNDYIRKFAELVKATLNPNRKVYIEHSNEVWNSMFQVHGYALQQANANQTRFRPNGASEFEGVMNYHSARSVEIFKIWAEVFGGTDRLVRVMGGWAANDWSTGVLMNFENAHQFIDAVAIAPYFGGYLGDANQTTRVLAMNDDQFFAELSGPALTQSLNWVRAHKAAVNARGKKLIAYEGGQHLVGNGSVMNNNAITAKFVAANSNPRMGAVYKAYLDGWLAAGGDLFANFSACSEHNQFGSWGARTNLVSPITAFPKAMAIREWAEAHKR